jgi:integrase
VKEAVHFGPDFRRPSAKTLRKHRQAQGLKLFEAHELRAMLAKAKLPLRAMLLLGINCGFGNSDCGNLPLSALDFERGWVVFARPKTGIERRIPLWPETVQALKDWLLVRPQAAKPQHAGLVFLTSKRGSWHKENDNPISKETAKVMKLCGLNGKRNFYAIRHSFQTFSEDRSGDFLAVRKIMGHATQDIADAYRERISDERLRRVVEHVRAWLFAPEKPEAPDVLELPQTKIG